MPLSALASMQLDDTLEHINVPSYVIDTAGVIRWVGSVGDGPVDLGRYRWAKGSSFSSGGPGTVVITPTVSVIRDPGKPPR